MSGQIFGDAELVTKDEVEAMLEAVMITEETVNQKITDSAEIIEHSISNVKSELETEIESALAEVNSEKSQREASEVTINQRVTDEAELRETTDNSLEAKITREIGDRETADAELVSRIETETTERKEYQRTVDETIENIIERITPAETTTAALVETEKTERKAADEELASSLDATLEAVNELKDKYNNLSAVETNTFEDKLFAVRFKNLPLAQLTIENTDRLISKNDVLGTVSDKYKPLMPITFSFISELTETQDTIEVNLFAMLTCRLDTNGNVTVIDKTAIPATFTGNVNSTTIAYITKE